MGDALLGAGATVAGGGASFAGGITQGMAARRQGLYQNQVAQINAQLSQMQAKDAISRGQTESSLALQRGDQTVSAQRALAGAGGVDPNSGSPAASQASSRVVSQLDALTISHNAALEAIGYNMQAQNFMTQGRMAKISGNNANNMDIMSGGMKFGQSLLQAQSNYNQYRPRVPVTSQGLISTSPIAQGGMTPEEAAFQPEDANSNASSEGAAWSDER